MAGLFLRHNGMSQSERDGIGPLRVFPHVGFVVVGFVLWIIYVIDDSSTLAWIAFAALLVVALLGFTMFAIWLQRRRSRGAVTEAVTPTPPAEQHFPVAVVGLHGLLAATTLVLVLLAAIGVGGS